jgi:hypothetical protein
MISLGKNVTPCDGWLLMNVCVEVKYIGDAADDTVAIKFEPSHVQIETFSVESQVCHLSI